MALLLTPGNIADISAAPGLLAAMPPARRLIADKEYDANSLRGTLGAQGTEAVSVPPGRDCPVSCTMSQCAMLAGSERGEWKVRRRTVALPSRITSVNTGTQRPGTVFKSMLWCCRRFGKLGWILPRAAWVVLPIPRTRPDRGCARNVLGAPCPTSWDVGFSPKTVSPVHASSSLAAIWAIPPPEQYPSKLPGLRQPTGPSAVRRM